MAYMSQEMKKELAPGIKAVLKEFGVKGSIAVKNHSTLVVNVAAGNIDFIGQEEEKRRAYAKESGREFYPVGGYVGVNTYNIDSQWKGQAKRFLERLSRAMMIGNHDNSDIMTDYFDVGWYININIGKWDKPYQLKIA